MATTMTDPATKGDLRRAMSRIRRDMATKKELMAMKKEILDMAIQLNKQNNREFRIFIQELNEQNRKKTFDDVQFLNENLVHDFRGALSDKISLLNDKVYAHDYEITRIKRHVHLL